MHKAHGLFRGRPKLADRRGVGRQALKERNGLKKAKSRRLGRECFNQSKVSLPVRGGQTNLKFVPVPRRDVREKELIET
jgi:hypothetical protein